MSWRSRVRLADEVAEVLRARINDRTYAPGELLHQEQLAEDLRVSRTPLREALRVLEQEGLVTNRPGRGVRVVRGDRTMVLAAYAVREVLDGLAARLASVRPGDVTQPRFAAMLDVQRAALEPWSARAYIAANVAFHTAIVELADNAFIAAQLSIVRITSQVFTSTAEDQRGEGLHLLSRERAVQAVDEHRGIAAAIVSGDATASEELARRHIRETINRFTEAEPAAGPGSTTRPQERS